MRQRIGFHVGAFLILICMGCAVALRWPLPEIGIQVDLRSGSVLEVDPGSAADTAGIQPGDQVSAVYGYPWEHVNTRLWLVPLPWHRGDTTPITLKRPSESFSALLKPGAPTGAVQLEKAVRALLAAVCWITGYFLGTSPRAADARLRRVAWFWLILGGSLALYLLVSVSSYRLTIVVLWLQCAILAPLSVAMHAWYPLRPLPPVSERRTGWLLGTSLGLMQIAMLLVIGRAASTVMAYQQLQTITRYAFLAAFGLSALLLWRTYHQTRIAHIRRQIRLIATACVLTACWWAVLLLLQRSDHPLPASLFWLAALLVPLAYLFGGASADLMRLDQIARRVLLHALTGLLILAAALIGIRSQQLAMSPAALALLGLGLYRPVARVAQRIAIGRTDDDTHYAALQQAITALGSSLHANRLATIIADSISETFQAPLALYLRTTTDEPALTLMVDRGMQVPPAIAVPPDEAAPRRISAVQLASNVQAQQGVTLGNHTLDEVVFHPSSTLWAVIRHQDGPILGVVMIGPRGDIDPYQPRDLQQINQLLAAASLALTNSVSYTAQVAAQQTIRQLYRHLQQAQEQTAAAIAREIHDEVLNVNLRLNIEALERLVAEIQDPALQARLEQIIDNEQSTSQMLRLICEQLHPTGTDDPFGLAMRIERLVEQAKARWTEHICLNINQEPVPVETPVQHEVVGIVREALTNAITHADATTITVVLQFPTKPAQPLRIEVRDNGQSGKPLAAQPGHMGLRSMQERAASIGGTVAWSRQHGGGTIVLIETPTQAKVQLEPVNWPDWAGYGAPI